MRLPWAVGTAARALPPIPPKVCTWFAHSYGSSDCNLFSSLFMLPFVVETVIEFRKKMCAVMHHLSLQLAPRRTDVSNYTLQSRKAYLADLMSVIATNCSIRVYNKIYSDSRMSTGLALSGSEPWFVSLLLSTARQVHTSNSHQRKSIGTIAWDLSFPSFPWPPQSSERPVRCWIRRTGFHQRWM